MHAAAHEFVARQVAERGPFARVVEIGSRDINGSIRSLFADDALVYVGLDLYPGPGVDWVGDARDYGDGQTGFAECVVCCEVLEHSPTWPGLMRHAASWLAPGGVLIVTCAAPGRREHSAIDGGRLHPGEDYCNVPAIRVADVLTGAGLDVVESHEVNRDTQVVAVRR